VEEVQSVVTLRADEGNAVKLAYQTLEGGSIHSSAILVG
jgi:hypothetical protein